MTNKCSMHAAIYTLSLTLCMSALHAGSEADFIARHTLPQGPLKVLLDNAFESTRKPEVAFGEEEFTFLIKAESLVLFANQAPNFLIKYLPLQSRRATRFYNKRNIDRVTVAEHMRELIVKNNLHHVVVPHKWLYHIPGTKNDLCDTNYVVVAERLELLSQQECKPLWLCLSKEAEDEMRLIIKETGFDDVRLANLFFTPEGKVAFIDTEPGWAPLLSNILLKPIHNKICASIGLRRLDKLKAQWEQEVHDYHQAQLQDLQDKS